MPFAGNIGIGEIAIVLVIALIVIGPKKLPDAARAAGPRDEGVQDVDRRRHQQPA